VIENLVLGRQSAVLKFTKLRTALGSGGNDRECPGSDAGAPPIAVRSEAV
jgi:hypothetical protein